MAPLSSVSPSLSRRLEESVSAGFGLQAQGAIQMDGQPQRWHQQAQAQRVVPLCQDRLEWAPDQLRLASAVLGDQASALLATTVQFTVREQASDSLYYINCEAFRIARRLAMDAWHYALRAEALDEIEAGTLGGRTR